METTVTDAGPFEKRIVLYVPEERLDDAKSAAARRLSRTMRVPGFRPGRAPRKVIESTVGAERLRAEAIDDALGELVGEALKDLDLTLAATPTVERIEDTDTGIEISVIVASWPSLTETPNYVGREIEVLNPRVSDDDMAEQIDRMREQFAELTEVERPAAMDDYAIIDLVAVDPEGAPITELAAQDLTIRVGPSFIEGLDEAIVGLSQGESKEFDAVLPEGFGDKAGTAAVITVAIKTIQEQVLPELTDAWVDDTTEFDTVDALRAELRGRISQGKFNQSWEQFRSQLINNIVDEIALEIPDSIITSEMENVLHRFNHSLSEQGVEFDDYLQVTGQSQETFVADLREAATKNVKTDLLLDAVAEDAGLIVEDEELAAMHSAVGQSTGESASQVAARLSDTQTKALIDDIVRKKAHDELLKAAVPIDEDGNPIDFEVLAAELTAQREEEE